MHLQACPTKKFNLMPTSLTHAEYWLAALLLLWGVYGVLASNHLLRKLMAMNIMQVGVIVFFIALAAKSGATAPVVVDVDQSIQASGYVNPLPHALMLTAIVVSVSTTARFKKRLCLSGSSDDASSRCSRRRDPVSLFPCNSIGRHFFETYWANASTSGTRSYTRPRFSNACPCPRGRELELSPWRLDAALGHRVCCRPP